MKPIRTVVVDDEPLARARLRRLLRDERDIVIVDECADGPAALETIRRQRPELVFLDVRLPGLSGLEVIEQLKGEMPPAVVFVTGHDHYAVPAFAAAATDFLLKPFTRERFKKALERARLRAQDRPRPDRRLAALVRRTHAPRPPAVISVKVGRSFIVVRIDDIEAIVARRAGTILHATDEVLHTRTSFSALGKKLPEGKFVRINRSTLVNGAKVQEIVCKTHGDGLVRLTGQQEFPLSRRWRQHWAALSSGKPRRRG